MSEFDAEELPPEDEQPAEAAVRTEGA